MARERQELIDRLAALGVSEREWIGMDEMSEDALELLLESVEQHQELWVVPEDDHVHDHRHAPGRTAPAHKLTLPGRIAAPSAAHARSGRSLGGPAALDVLGSRDPAGDRDLVNVRTFFNDP